MSGQRAGGGGGSVAAVGCVSASSLGRWAGSGAALSVAVYGCVGVSLLVRAGSAYIKVRLGRVGPL